MTTLFSTPSQSPGNHRRGVLYIVLGLIVAIVLMIAVAGCPS
ncbi:MAG TPA: hypothetical protein VKC35_05535 [Vicinamibacterales bacterium]|nr:hypothetical protein [Vicinamibacterales bacterium]